VQTFSLFNENLALGEKDEAPMLYCGERIGDGNPPHVEIAVDPLDGTTLTAQGMCVHF